MYAPTLGVLGAVIGLIAALGNLSDIDLSNITYIDRYALQGGNFSEVVLGEKVEYIGIEAFYGNENLTRVVIPAGTCAFDFSSVFYKCPVSEVEISEENANFTLYEGGVYNADKTALYKYVGTSESIVLPEGVKSIADGAFYGSGLTSIVIPDGVERIGNEAFCGCRSLTSIIIPDGVESIGNEVFSYCSSLESVSIGKGVKSIGERAFHYCGSLTSVTFKDPDGWMANGTALSAAELSDPATAAEYLRDKYCDYGWSRS